MKTASLRAISGGRPPRAARPPAPSWARALVATMEVSDLLALREQSVRCLGAAPLGSATSAIFAALLRASREELLRRRVTALYDPGAAA